MSAHGGIFYFDRRPVSTRVSAALGTACARYGPDDGAVCSPAAGIAMVYRRLQVAPEDHTDRQPIDMGHGQWLTWDGRLDNRADLMIELGLRPSAFTPDGQVVAAAYQRWNERVYERLVGDWSLIVCDTQKNVVTLANDFMAVRPMFYAITDKYCAWCTALEALVDLLGRQTTFDEEYLQSRLVRCPLPGRTAYRGIFVLLGGHVLTVSASGRWHARQYWHLPTEQIRHRDPRDYEVQFRTLFKQAVADRLRSDRPVWMELSGGLDSSAVVCMAANLAQEGRIPPHALATLSYVMAEDDEARFKTAVETATGLRAIHVPLANDAPPTFPTHVHLRDVNPALLDAYEQMKVAGARVLLTGRFGDNINGNFRIDLTTIASALRAGRPLELLKQVRLWSLSSREPAWKLLWMACLELMPQVTQVRRAYKEALRSLRIGASSSATSTETLPFSPATLTKVRMVEEQFVRWCRTERRPWLSSNLAKSLALHVLTCSLVSPPEHPEATHTHPFADRRLVEFITSIDWSLVCAPGQPRALMRRALAGLLPAAIARRFSKGYAQPFWARRSTALAHLLVHQDTLQVVERGYVDPEILGTALDMTADGPVLAATGLGTVSILESWLRLTRPSQDNAQ